MSNRIPRLAKKLSALLLLLASAACSDSPARVVAPDVEVRADLSGIPSSANTVLQVSALSPGFLYSFTAAQFFVGGFQATGAGAIGTFEAYCINVLNATPAVGTNFTVRSLSIEEAVQPANLTALQRVLGATIDATAMRKKLRQSAYLNAQFSAEPTTSWDEIQAASWKLYTLTSAQRSALGTSNPTLEATFLNASSSWADDAANSTANWRVVVDARAWDPGFAATSLAQIFMAKNNPASLGNFVWHDLNANGVQDAGEPGIAGATVTATGPNGALANILTDANGNYLFTDLPAGQYTVCVALPAGFTDVSPSGQGTNTALDSDGSGTNNCATVTLAAGQNNLDVDFGFFKRAAVGDLVWYDQNGNGVQDAGELGISGATVTITGPNGFTASTTTNGTGGYAFTNLLPGTYTICVATPASYTGPTLAGQGSDATKDSNGSGTNNCATVTLTSGQTDNTIDFGFTRAKASLGDFVWHDLNANGVQDSGEPGIGNASVTITGPNGYSSSATTNGAGAYGFSNLEPGEYTVCVAKPSGYTDVSPASVGDGAKDSNGSGVGNCATVSLAAGQNDPTIDFGFFQRAAVGDLVWYDQNGNGVQDAGEPGISGATVTITGPNGFTASTTTNGTGGYAFTNLLPGTYTICVATPASYTGPTLAGQGGDATKDSNGSGTNNCATVTLTSGQTDNTIDFGFLRPAATGRLGNYTWIDANGNGRQDAGEPFLNGVTVSLAGQATGTKITSGGGLYLFDNLAAGTYTVTATAPTGFTFTTANSPLATNGTDSNVNPTSVTLAAGGEDLTIDFGFVPLPGSGQGCTPGFWKQSQKFGNWKWYTRTDMVDAVFGVTFRSTERNNPTGALTLLQALELNGNGGNEQLFRHGTAALLNAVYQSGVSYPFTAAQVITMVRTAWQSGNATTIANTHRQLSVANERGCPLN